MAIDYYDYNDLFSYSCADAYMIVGGRGVGKTYGLRKEFVKDFEQKGLRFGEVCRFAKEIPDVANGYFSKFEEKIEFPNLILTTEGNKAFYSQREAQHGAKIEKELFGYFVGLTEQQSLKKRTFSRVGKIVLDEAIIDKETDKYHDYLRNEFVTLMNVCSTLWREEPGEIVQGRKLILLGNAVDFVNPYFYALGVDRPPTYGKHWFNNKSFLLDYVPPRIAEDNQESTIVGRLLRGNEETKRMFANAFTDVSDEFIEQKPRDSKFLGGIVYQGNQYGIWWHKDSKKVFVNSKIPNNAEPVFVLTDRDNRINYKAVKASSVEMQSIANIYYGGMFRYESPAVQMRFVEVLSLLGIRKY